MVVFQPKNLSSDGAVSKMQTIGRVSKNCRAQRKIRDDEISYGQGISKKINKIMRKRM
jgi:hypothetical protein